MKTKIQLVSVWRGGGFAFGFFPFSDFKMGLLCCMPVLEPFVEPSLEARALEIANELGQSGRGHSGLREGSGAKLSWQLANCLE